MSGDEIRERKSQKLKVIKYKYLDLVSTFEGNGFINQFFYRPSNKFINWVVGTRQYDIFIFLNKYFYDYFLILHPSVDVK